MVTGVNDAPRHRRARRVLKFVKVACGLALVVAVTLAAAAWLLVRDELQAVRPMVERSRTVRLELASAALLAAEDPRFLARPPLIPAVRCLRPGVVCCGGGAAVSEILARYVTRPTRATRWHLETKLVSVAISRFYAPEELLRAYVSEVYLGTRNRRHIKGVEAAARMYFGKRASQLTPAEAALLGAMVRGPNYVLEDHERALQRRNLVLARMRDDGIIGEDSYRRASLEPIRVRNGA